VLRDTGPLGTLSDQSFEYLASRIGKMPKPGENAVRLTGRNDKASEITKEFRNKLPGAEMVYRWAFDHV
jgi:hypothetical protein